MNEVTTPVVATEAPAVAVKKTPIAKKPIPTKTPIVKTAPKKAEPKSESKGPKLWNKKRIQIVTAMRKLNANSADQSKTAEQISKKAGGDLTEVNVVRYCAEQEPLVASGIVKRVKMEGNTQITYHLTAKGVKCTIAE